MKKIIKQIISWPGINSLVRPHLVKATIKKKSKEIQEHYVELSDRHITNLNIVLNREKLLEFFPKQVIAAEIGVDEGAFAQNILSITQPKRLHLIDLWNSPHCPEEKFLAVNTKFKSEIQHGQVEINRGDSLTIIKTFPDQYFDWVYLDTGHGFKLTSNELDMLRYKVKRFGIIAGHDYCRFKSDGSARFGVVEAVNRFCVENDYEFLYLTMETHRHLSFAIRKIGNQV